MKNSFSRLQTRIQSFLDKSFRHERGETTTKEIQSVGNEQRAIARARLLNIFRKQIKILTLLVMQIEGKRMEARWRNSKIASQIFYLNRKKKYI